MNRYLVIILTVVALSLPGLTWAQCHLDGRTYNNGAVVAGYVCRDGEWHKL